MNNIKPTTKKELIMLRNANREIIEQRDKKNKEIERNMNTIISQKYKDDDDLSLYRKQRANKKVKNPATKKPVRNVVKKSCKRCK